MILQVNTKKLILRYRLYSDTMKMESKKGIKHHIQKYTNVNE